MFLNGVPIILLISFLPPTNAFFFVSVVKTLQMWLNKSHKLKIPLNILRNIKKRQINVICVPDPNENPSLLYWYGTLHPSWWHRTCVMVNIWMPINSSTRDIDVDCIMYKEIWSALYSWSNILRRTYGTVMYYIHTLVSGIYLDSYFVQTLCKWWISDLYAYLLYCASYVYFSSSTCEFMEIGFIVALSRWSVIN